MKKIFCWIFAILILLTGCAAPAAASQTEAAQPQEPQGMLLSTLEVPERFAGDWTGVEGLVTVHADASVELPEVDTIPIATVKRRNFTDEDAEKLITYFCGDAPFNQIVYETKQSAQARLDRYEAIKRGDEEPTGDLVDHIRVEGEAYLDKRIADYKKILETAPDENERIPASRKFVPNDLMNNEEVEGYAELPDKNVFIYMCNEPMGEPDTHAAAWVEGYNGANFGGAGRYYCLEDGQTPAKCSLTREQALKVGDELIAALGENDLVCAQVKGIMFTEGMPYPVSNSEDDTVKPVVDKEGGYELTYTRKVEGVGVMVPEYYATSSESGSKGNWYYELVTVAVADQGIVHFRWISPYASPTVTAQRSELITFQEAADVFSKMIMVTNQDLLDINKSNNLTTRYDCKIDRVSMDYIRIRDRDNFSEGKLVQAWNFWGTVTSTTDGHPEWTNTWEHTVLLTVNALDGSIIDMSLGY